MTMSGPNADKMPKQAPIKTSTTTWLVKGVGIVKGVYELGEPGAKTTPPMELVSYTK